MSDSQEKAPVKPKRLVQARGFSRPSFTFLLCLAAIAGGLFYHHENYGHSFLTSSKSGPLIVVKPTPLPEPTPDLAPPAPSLDGPTADTIPETGKTIAPAPAGDTLPPSKLDIDAFYQRARKIMQERAKSQINQYQSSLGINLGGFEADLRSSVRKQGVGAAKQKKALEESLVVLREGGSRLPPDLAEDFGEFPDSEKIASTYLNKQTALDATFRKAMASHAATYVVGMQKQIERSQAENDATAIKLIEDEIRLTREEAEYFPNLMLGRAPRSAPSTSGNEDGGFVTPPDAGFGGFVLPTEE